LDKALEAFTHTIALDHNDLPSYFSRAEIYFAQGDMKHAADDYRKVARSSGDTKLKQMAQERLDQIDARD
jgi:Tfp pilus assembly protein PilF